MFSMFSKGCISLVPSSRLGPSLILRKLVLGGGIVGCFSFRERMQISGIHRCSILFPWGVSYQGLSASWVLVGWLYG